MLGLAYELATGKTLGPDDYTGGPAVPPRFILVGSGLFVPRTCDGLMAEGDRLDRAKCGNGTGGERLVEVTM